MFIAWWHIKILLYRRRLHLKKCWWKNLPTSSVDAVGVILMKYFYIPCITCMLFVGD